MRPVFYGVLLCGALCSAPGANAFKLQAFGGSDDPLPAASSRQVLGFMRQFTSDVHERITREAHAMAGVPLADGVMAGVRWNDNPPALRLGVLFGACDAPADRAGESVGCFASMLRIDRMALEAISQREQAIAPLRSHFGDMQFLHAMAGRAGEPAVETRRNILRWAEFTWRVARGEIRPGARVHELRRGGSPLDPATAEWVSALFASPAKKTWTVRDLFVATTGDLRQVAFGALLHMVEDSYSAAHVRRAALRVQANGCPSYDAADAIAAFYTYSGQDTEKHGLCDDAPDWLETPRRGSPVEVLAELVRARREGRDWPAVRPMLEETVLRLADDAAAAAPGRCFEIVANPLAPEDSTAPPTALDPACREARP
jgi:hypothetical protein